MSIIEIIFEFIFTPGLVKLGIAIGVILAACAWYLLPEHVDRTAIGAWSVALGFIGGWIFLYQSKKNK